MMDQQKQVKFELKIIYSINFSEKNIVVNSKNGFAIYSLHTLKPIYSQSGKFWDSVFIPETNYIAYVKHEEEESSKRKVHFFDFCHEKIVSTITIKYQIEQIKVGKNCIALSGLSSISVLHFPTLKPIYDGVAGTGIHNVFDISYQGLTLAHDCQTKGRIIVHNFTNIESEKKKKSTNLSQKKKNEFRYTQSKLKKIAKQILQINAHKESISIIKLSPNGSRVATASNKGTMIRIFLATHGQIWQQLRISYQLCRIHDINFFETGNVLSCVNEKNEVKLFNVKLEPSEEEYESDRRGHKIYQQQNPKSYFSFLSIFNSNLGNDYSFSDFKLIRPPQPEIEQEKQKQIEKMPFIIEQQEQKEDSESPKKQSQQLHLDTILNIKQQPSITSLDEVKTRSRSTLTRKSSTINKKKQEIFIPKVYNTICRVHIGGDNSLWIIKGYFIYALKYDPFHGGQMYHLKTMIIN